MLKFREITVNLLNKVIIITSGDNEFIIITSGDKFIITLGDNGNYTRDNFHYHSFIRRQYNNTKYLY